MKAQVINTTFVHDGIYYYPNSIVELPPDTVKKYPKTLLAIDLFSKNNAKSEIDSSETVQSNSNLPEASTENNIIVKTKISKKNKRSK